MTLRLSKEDERLLALLAQEDGVSRQEATIRAIHEVDEAGSFRSRNSDSSWAGL